LALRVADLLVVLSGDTKGFENAMQRVAKNTQALGSKMQSVGNNLTMKVALPLAAVGAASAKMAADFDDSLNRMVSLVGIARDQVNAWRGDVRETAKATGQSANDLAEAMFFITSAGARGKTAMEILKASAQAAKIGLGETKNVAFAAVSAVNAYGAANLDASEAVAILVKTVREGNLEASTLAPTLGRVLPIASELGVSFNQVGAAYAAMTRLGVNAEESATMLRSVMATLLKPTKGARDQLEAFGLSASGLRTQLREKGLLDVLLTLRQRFGDNEEAMTKVFPNVRALSGVLNLVGANAEKTQEIFDSLAKTTSEDLALAAQEAEVSYKVRFNKALQTVKDSFLELGDKILPTVVPLFERIAGAVENVTMVLGNMSPVTKGFLAFFATLGLVVPPLIILLGTFIKSVGVLAAAMSTYTKATGVATMATNGFTISSARATAQTGLMSQAMFTASTAGHKLRGMLGSGGLLAVLVSLIPLAYDLGKAMAGMFDPAMDPMSEFAEELAGNGALFAMTIDQLELQKKKLGLVGDEWKINTQHTKDNARALAEMHDKLQQEIQARIRQRDTLEEVNEEADKEQRRMDRVKEALLAQKQQIDATTEALREKYNVVTRSDVIKAIQDQVRDYKKLKDLGIDLGEGAGDFGDQLITNLENVKRYKVPWSELGEGVKEMSAELAQKQVPALQQLVTDIGSMGPAYEQMMPAITGAMTEMTDALTGELIKLPDMLGQAAGEAAERVKAELGGGFMGAGEEGTQAIKNKMDELQEYANSHPLVWPIKPVTDAPPQGGDLP